MSVVNLIEEEARKHPSKKAVIVPKGDESSSYTYAELIKNCEKLSTHFQKAGVTKGSRVLFFVKPSLNFSVITFSLFKLGAVPVFIDPGMGLKNLLACTKKAGPHFFITETKGVLLKLLFGKAFKGIKKTFTTKSFLGFTSIEKILAEEALSGKISYPKLTGDDLASIIFTSGGTGRPKGVLYKHAMFHAQTELLREQFSYTETDRDLPGFPLFSMMTIAMGVPSVIPEMDPSKPAQCEPQKIVENIQNHKVTTISGSPAIWERVGRYCKENHITLPSVRALIMFGAPIPKSLHEMFEPILVNGTSYTPYGATECLPVSHISWKELKETTLPKDFRHKAICIGSPVPETKLKVIRELGKGSFNFSQVEELPPFQVGEILVQGKQASPAYLENEEATKQAKIKDGESFWHRMGDLGFYDEEGKLWFCGRAAHKVTSLPSGQENFSLPCELVFNDHPEIKKTALICLDRGLEQEAALVIERRDKKTKLSPAEKKGFREELFKRQKSSENTKHLEKFYLHKNLPVDRRHNIKIDRKALSEHFSKKQESCL